MPTAPQLPQPPKKGVVTSWQCPKDGSPRIGLNAACPLCGKTKSERRGCRVYTESIPNIWKCHMCGHEQILRKDKNCLGKHKPDNTTCRGNNRDCRHRYCDDCTTQWDYSQEFRDSLKPPEPEPSKYWECCYCKSPYNLETVQGSGGVEYGNYQCGGSILVGRGRERKRQVRCPHAKCGRCTRNITYASSS